MTIARTLAHIFLLARRHWVHLANVVALAMVVLPLLAPALMHLGLADVAHLVYRICALQCHQLPSRSFFLGAYQVGVCERCISIDAAILAAGLAYAVWRSPLRFRWWTPWFLVVALAPLTLDGGTQYLGWRESTWWLRVLTGALYGAGLVLFFYPLVDWLLAWGLAQFARYQVLNPQEVSS